MTFCASRLLSAVLFILAASEPASAMTLVTSARSEMPSTEQLKKISPNYGQYLRQFQEDKKPFADFVWGQPREPPLPAMVSALRQSIEIGSAEDADPAYFGYCAYMGKYQDIIAASVKKHRKLDVDPQDCFVTNGALAGLVVSLLVLTDPGDEVVIVEPPYYLYKPMCDLMQTKCVTVPCRQDDFDLDVDSIAAAITQRTRVVIINSPNNPTGRIYPEATLQRLADVLLRANAGRDRPIMLISDEAYCRIVFDGAFAPSPLASYAYSLSVYSYGKQTLMPGERMGYICISPHMPVAAREELRPALSRVANALWARPDTVPGRALEQIDKAEVDMQVMQRRRDRLVEGLRSAGYQVNSPEGTFYMMLQSPRGMGEQKFIQELASSRVLVAAGEAMGLEGTVRLSLTAAEEMIDFALPVFAKLNTATN